VCPAFVLNAIQNLAASITTVPEIVLDDIANATQATYEPDYGIYSLPCNSKFEFTLELTGVTLPITKKQAIMQVEDKCYLAFEHTKGQYVDFVLDKCLPDILTH
jgi:hypothetical protein